MYNYNNQYYNGMQPQKNNSTTVILIIIILLLLCCCCGGVGSFVIYAVATYEEDSNYSYKQIDASDYEYKKLDNKEDEHYWGNKYKSSDDSMIYFESDGTYEWFKTDKDYDNVYKGTYSVIFGQEALDYVVYDLSEYGITSEEMDDYFERNSGSELYKFG